MKPWIVGNWKMNTDSASGAALASAIAAGAAAVSTRAQLGIAPPLPYLSLIRSALGSAPVDLGAQNCHEAKSGAFTGEASAGMLRDIGATFVILGHSERRQLFHEGEARLRSKVLAAVGAGLKVIFCVGETLAERDENRHEELVRYQTHIGLSGLNASTLSSMTIAYEPVWAIGTGRTATPQQAGEMHAVIRSQLSKSFGPNVAQQTRILYGGSVKADNAAELLKTPGIDGALVGGASLDAGSFLAIAAAAP